MIAKKEESFYYIDNKKFTNAVVEYNKLVEQAEKNNKKKPVVTEYIARCFLDIAEGLVRKGNFSNYTWREEMVMDGVEICLRYMKNFDINASTKSGKPNAFGYFTQITYYAFLQRIAKEKKQTKTKIKYILESGLENDYNNVENEYGNIATNNFIDELKTRIEKVNSFDQELKEYKALIKEHEVEEKNKKKKKNKK